MPNISIILLTKNESDNLKTWSKWIYEIKKVNEIIVVDDNSTDNSVKIVKKLINSSLSVKTFSRGLDNNFAAQRQYAVSKSTNDWILWLDADEQPSEPLISYINHIDINKYDHYGFKRADLFLGCQLKHGETSSQHFIRLFNRKHGNFSGKVHEIWFSFKPTHNCDFEIIHHPHKDLKAFFNKLNFYSDIRAKELYEAKIPANIFQIIFYPLGKFLHNYFLRLGFLDGTAGMILALGMSFHSFLVRSKLWSMQNH